MTVSLSHVSANALGDFTVNVYSSSTRIDSFDASDGVNNEISKGVITGQNYYIRVYHWKQVHINTN